MKRISTAIILMAMLAGCAGRAPTQIPIVQAKDASMDCTAINAELAYDTSKESELKTEETNKRGQNVAAGVVGAVLFWPALFLMDFQDAAGNERKALEARDTYLATLAAQRCGAQTASQGGWIGATQTESKR